MATTKKNDESSQITVWELPLREKLMRIQTELKAPKNLWNDYAKFKYRNTESILEALKPFEKLYGVSVIITDEIINVSGRFYVKAIAEIYDVRESYMGVRISATAYAREDESKKGMDGAQLTGACSSYARKMALSALFLLDDSQDIDSTESSGNATEAKSEPQKASSKSSTHSKDEIKAKYQELISFCKENGYDLTTVCSEYKLNAKSSWEEFDNVLRRLRYNLALNSKPTSSAPEISPAVSELLENSQEDVPYEVN